MGMNHERLALLIAVRSGLVQLERGLAPIPTQLWHTAAPHTPPTPRLQPPGTGTAAARAHHARPLSPVGSAFFLLAFGPVIYLQAVACRACLSSMCLVWFDSQGLEFEVDICALAVADALEDGLLVTGDVVAADVKDRQCPLGAVLVLGLATVLANASDEGHVFVLSSNIRRG